VLSLLFFVKRNCESQTQLTHPDKLEVSLSVVFPFFKIQHNLQDKLLKSSSSNHSCVVCFQSN
jgi:hypothetical protein